MSERKGGDGKIDLDELEKLDKKLGGVKPDKARLREFLAVKPKPNASQETDRQPKGKQNRQP